MKKLTSIILLLLLNMTQAEMMVVSGEASLFSGISYCKNTISVASQKKGQLEAFQVALRRAQVRCLDSEIILQQISSLIQCLDRDVHSNQMFFVPQVNFTINYRFFCSEPKLGEL